MTDRGRGDLNR